MASPEHADDWEAVETRSDFLELLGLLAGDWEVDEAKRQVRERSSLWATEGESWALGTRGAWLEAMQAWMTAMGDSPGTTQLDVDPPSWRTFAFILAASRYYE